MARRRKNGIPKLIILAVIVVFVGGALILTQPSLDLQSIFAGDFLDSATDTFSLPLNEFITPRSLALIQIPTSDIDCFTKFTLVAKNTAGQTIAVEQSSANISPIFIQTDLFVIGATSELAKIGSYELTPKMRCDNKHVDGGLIGYGIQSGSKFFFTVKIRDSSGVFQTVGTFATPSFSHGDLNDNFERFLPKVTIPASTIDARATQEDFRYNSAISFVMSGEITLTSIPAGVNYKYFTGQNTVVQTQHLVTVDKVPTFCPTGQTGTPPNCTTIPLQNQEIEITEIKRKSDGADLMGNWNNKINVLDDDLNAVTIQVRALLRDFRVADSGEISPEARIVLSASPFTAQTQNVFMTREAGSGTLGNFFRVDIQVPLGTNAGTYAVEVSSRDRSQTASRGFQVEEMSNNQTCVSPKILQGGLCVNPTLPPDENVCPSGQSGTPPNCVDNNTMTCEMSGQEGIFPDCSDPQTPPDGNGGTTTPTVATSLGKINFLEKYVGTGDTTRGCENTGTVPSAGVELVSFQLLGEDVKCKDQRFSEVDIRPILDFGDSDTLKRFSINTGTAVVNHKLQMSVNNPFPANAEFSCQESPTANAVPDCNVSNHVNMNDPSVSLAFEEVTKLLTPLDIGTSGTYELSFVNLKASNLEQKLKDAGLSLVDGDVYSYMLQVDGRVDGTLDGNPVTIVIPSMVITQSFKFKETGSGCNLEVSFVDDNGQCMPIPRVCTAPLELNPSTNTCEAPPQDPNCPAGTSPPDFTPFEPQDCIITPSNKICEPIPTCIAGDTHDSTGQLDDCGFDILQCVPIIDVTTGIDPVTGKPITIEPNPAGGCEMGYTLNAFGKCQLIGSGTNNNNEDPDGTRNDENLCALDDDFNFGQCIASITGSLTTGGEGDEGLSTLFTVSVLVIIIIIIIAVVVRMRRRGGFGV